MSEETYELVKAAIEHVWERAGEQPRLDEVAQAMGLSEAHAQRVFQEWAGISAKRLVQVLTWEGARARLRRGDSVLDAALEAGLSGPGRLHDLSVALEAMTPGEAAKKGEGLTIAWGVSATPLGEAVIGSTARGVCAWRFVGEGFGVDEARAEIEAEWPRASLEHQDAQAQEVARRAFARDEGGSLSVLVKGTNFQVAVWRALLAIPPGHTVSYTAVARAVERPKASRAVGSAVGANPIAWLIPCHRVLRANAALGGYRWGLERKRAALTYERAWGED